MVETECKRILVVDDNRLMVNMLRDCLEQAGYVVVSASTGLLALKTLSDHDDWHLVLLDVEMPDMDGFEVVRQLRNSTRTNHLPVVLLSSRSSVADKVRGLEVGADDYITKPFVIEELQARVMAHMRRARQARSLSPLTGLPGNMVIDQDLRQKVADQVPLAVLYVDMDNFKAYNDSYGFLQGDEAIKLLAHTLEQAKSRFGGAEDLVGHIGGDDFVVISTPERADILSREIIARFDQDMRCLYDHRATELPSISLSIAVVTNEQCHFRSHWEVGELAAGAKRQAKSIPGSVFVRGSQLQSELQLGRATEPQQLDRQKSILVVEDDQLLSAILKRDLESNGHNVLLAGSVMAALQAMRLRRPDMLVLDVVLPGTSGYTLCRRLKADQATKSIPVLIVSSVARAEEALAAGADAFLRKPFAAPELTAAVNRLLMKQAEAPNQLEPE